MRKCAGSGGGVRLKGDVEAELFNLAGEASGVGLGIGPAGEVVDAELGVGLLLGEDVPGDHEHGVRDGEDGLGLAPAAEAAPEALVLRAQVRAAVRVAAQAASTSAVRSAVSPLRARPA